MGHRASIFGGNWDNAANSGSRASNWNNYPWNSNGNIGARLVCEDMINRNKVLQVCHGTLGRPFIMWSAIRSCFGKHLWGFRKTGSSAARRETRVWLAGVRCG